MEDRKLVIITGGAKGIGASCAKVFSENSFNVVILDVDKEKGKEVAGRLGEACQFIACDVTNPMEVQGAVKKSVDRFSEVEVLVNNAGINPYGTLTETTYELWDQVMDINLKSNFICAKECIPSMQRNGKGVVVNVASVQSFVTQKKVAAYTTSKSAILGLTRSIAVDYSPAIRSVAICPGTVDTPMLREALQESENPQEVYHECEDMHLAKRVADPKEIADLIYFVASEKADFITGQPIRIDGGLGIMVGGSKQ